MSLASLYQIVVFSWQSFWRNIWLSIVTITIIVLALIAINCLIVLNIIVDTGIAFLEEKIDVSIYFKHTATEPQVLEAQTYLSSLAQVENINYISQQTALQNFRQFHQENTTIIESLEELEQNPLGATLVIKAKNLENYPEIISVLDNSKYKDLILEKNFDDHKTSISRLENVSKTINRIGLITVAVFIFIASMIVFNTIRIAIYTHRQEITIMKLVGASNWFIRSPFLVESVWYGILATVLSIGVMFPLLNLIQPNIQKFFCPAGFCILTTDFNIVSYFTKNLLLIFGVEFLSVVLLNVISSSIAIRRYLKV